MQTSHIGLLCLVAVLFWRLAASRRRKGNVPLVPGPPAATRLLGSLVDYQTGKGKTWHRHYGQIVRYKGFLGEDRLSVTDPVAIAHLLTAGPYTFDRELVSKPRMKFMFGDGLLNSIGEKHKRFRNSMGPAFNAPAINDLRPIFQSKADELRDRWEAQCLAAGGSAVVKGGEDIGLATVNVIGEAACGYEFDGFNAGLGNSLLRSFAIISATVGERSYANVFMENLVDFLPHSFFRALIALPTSTGRMIADAIRTLNEAAGILFRRALADADDSTSSTSNRDLLSVLVRANATESTKRKLSDEEVQTSMVTLFQTSFSSTSIITLTILWILGEHPALQTKLRAELVSDLADDGPYLDAVFREGVRLSKLSSIGREAMEDTTLPFGRPVTLTDGRIIHELLLRKGQLIDIPLTAFNTDPERLGKDADEFDPERFIDERRARYAEWKAGMDEGIMIFGFGTRACMGWRFATLEMKTMIATMVRRFEFSIEDPDTDESQLRVRLLDPA